MRKVLFSKKKLNRNNLKEKNIKLINIENTNFEKNKVYTKLIRQQDRLGDDYKFSYVSPTDVNNNLEIVLPKM